MVSVAGFLTPHLLFFFGFPIRNIQTRNNILKKVQKLSELARIMVNKTGFDILIIETNALLGKR